jgi:pimeloyl-ACP methyl ester carboxylesterase
MMAGLPGYDVRSAGTQPQARIVVTEGMIGWAKLNKAAARLSEAVQVMRPTMLEFYRRTGATVFGAACLLLPGGCAARPDRLGGHAPLLLPGEVPINRGAGRGEHLFLTLTGGTGEELLFVVDTGAPQTILDKFLEPRLGKRLASRRVRYGWFGVRAVGVYAAPKLFLNDIPLQTGPEALTDDLGGMFPGRPIAGILGMDCLRHYCVQLDFAASRMRFLDPDRLKEAGLGERFPLTLLFGSLWTRAQVFGVKSWQVRIDTGDSADGVLKPRPFSGQLRLQTALWTNQWKAASGAARRDAVFLHGAFAGKNYSDLRIHESPAELWFWHENAICLRFLGRHLTTLNFPKREMFLKRQTSDALPEDGSPTRPESPTLAWWERMNAATNGGGAEALAVCLMAAPNLHPSGALSPAYWWSHNNPQFRPLQIPVGPPAARLQTTLLNPGNYHLRFESKVKRKADGGIELLLKAESGEKPGMTPLPERGIIVLLHDYNSQKESLTWWACLLAQSGYRVLLVDLRGHGESTGQTVSFGKYETADLTELLDHLGERPASIGAVGVLGVGTGANLALNWAARDRRVHTVVAIAPHDQLEPIFQRLAAEEKRPLPPVLLKRGLSLAVARLGLDWEEWSGETAVRRLQTPVFLIGGGRDSVTSTNDLNRLAQSAAAGSKLLVIPEAGHREVRYWFHELAEPVAAWFNEHLATKPEQ